MKSTGDSMLLFTVKSRNRRRTMRYDIRPFSTLCDSIAMSFLMYIPSTQAYQL
jgi:hypothetical protein